MIRFATVLTAGLLALSGAAEAQTYPNPSRSIRVIAPYGAGQATDLMCRAFIEALKTSLNHPSIVIENKPGAGGNIGGAEAAKSTPDGYTLLGAAAGAMTIGTAIWPNIPYDIFKDFVPISMLADYPMLVVVNKDHPAKTIAELVAWLKANPDKANYPTPSPVFTLPIEHFKIKTSAPAQAISYPSSNESVTSLLGGQTAFGFVETPAVVPQIQSGGLRALAVTITTRIPELPDVPTLAEAGVPEVIGGTWLALMAPAGTPMPIIKKLEGACRQIGASDDFKARMKSLSGTPIGSSADELTAQMRTELQRWAAVVKSANIKFDQ